MRFVYDCMCLCTQEREGERSVWRWDSGMVGATVDGLGWGLNWGKCFGVDGGLGGV